MTTPLPAVLAAEFQSLETDALIELYEIDATSLLDPSGNPGAVYRFVPGTLPQAMSGSVAATSTTTLVYLDKLLSPSPGVLNVYVAQLTLPDGTVVPDKLISAFGTYVNGANTFSVITLSVAVATAPSIGSTWVIYGPGIVRFGGLSYTPFPIVITDFTTSGQGKLPVPRMRIDNTILLAGSLPLATALVTQYGDMLGAKVTRIRTQAQFLDGQPGADSSAIVAPDIFTIDRKSAQNKVALEFELAAALDQRGLKLPARQIIANSCNFIYRRWDGSTFVAGTCPWAGGTYFTATGASTGSASADRCGKKLSDCILRYGNNPTPYGGFPGVAPVQF